MTIPADEERDSDLILSVALNDVDVLLAEVERVSRDLAEARALADHRAELLQQISGELSACVWLRGQVRTVVGLAEAVIRMSEPGFEDQASVRAGEIVRIFATTADGNAPIESPAAALSPVDVPAQPASQDQISEE